MDAEVYIKDSSFLPDIIEVKPGTRVCFLNEDAVRHEIHCKNHTSLFPQNIDAEKKCYYHFPKLGRYEITSPGSEMKCVVEVVEQERENLPGRNTLHFPTSKEKTWLKARHLIQQQELQRQEQRDGKATVVSSPDDIHDHIGGISQEDFRISQQEDAVQRLRREQIKWANDSSRKAYSSSDSDEDAVEFSRTRRRLKASRQRSRSDARPSKVHQATVTECIEAANTPESIAKVFESGTKGSAVQSCAITAVTASSPAVLTKGPNAPPMPSSVDSRGPVQNLSL